jgi:hypothetical protein
MLRSRAVRTVLRRVVLVLVGLELLYLVIGNAILRSQLIQSAIAEADGFHLQVSRAYTLWPGRVYLRDFRLRVEDYNVQFELTFDRGTVDISLSELAFKKFHVTKLDADGTRFRMRHKLITVGDDAERVAAYPPIAGFADPPYYVGVRAPPIPDDEYNLWQVRIDNVTARARELWLMEIRFVGEAVARGSFVVRPARWVQVTGSELTLERGSLRLGQHLVAERVRGHIRCDVPDMDVQATEGSQVFREISSRIELRLSEGRLSFLQAYLARLGSARYDGQADYHVDLKLQRGVVQPGSRIAMLAAPLVLQHEFGNLTGDAMVSLTRATDDLSGKLDLAANAPLLRANSPRRSGPGPSIHGLRGSLSVLAANLAGQLSLGDAQLAVEDVKVPDLSWLDSDATKLGGSLRGQLQLQRSAAGLLAGQGEVSVSNGRVARDAFAASAQLQARLAVAPSRTSNLVVSRMQLDLQELTMRQGPQRTKPVAASLTGEGLRVDANGAPAARGQLSLRLSSTEAILPLFVGGALREVGSAALELKSLNGRADLELTGERMALTHIDARSGRLRLQGHVEQRRRQPTGALLLSSGPLNVGVTLKNGGTEVSPFVSDDWLAPPRS